MYGQETSAEDPAEGEQAGSGCRDLLPPPAPEEDYEGWPEENRSSSGVTVLNLGGQREYLSVVEELLSGFSIMTPPEAGHLHDGLLSGAPPGWEDVVQARERLRRALPETVHELHKLKMLLEARVGAAEARLESAQASARGQEENSQERAEAARERDESRAMLEAFIQAAAAKVRRSAQHRADRPRWLTEEQPAASSWEHWT